jgi:hypothetical protein
MTLPKDLGNIHTTSLSWRKLHDEELHNLYSSPNIIRMTKSRKMRWEGHVAQMGEKSNAYKILVGKLQEKITSRKTKT